MTDYANIMKALRSGSGEMDLGKKAENYKAFDELMRQGVSITDLVQRLESLEARVKEMDDNPHDREVFAVMESAVADDAEVIKAKAHRDEVMERILTESCMRDKRFADADREYRTAVNAAYVKAKG